MTKLSSLLGLIDRIPGLPVSAVITSNHLRKLVPSDPANWVYSAETGPGNKWFVQIGVANDGLVDQVLSLQVSGGVEDAARAIDMLKDHFKVAA